MFTNWRTDDSGAFHVDVASAIAPPAPAPIPWRTHDAKSPGKAAQRLPPSQPPHHKRPSERLIADLMTHIHDCPFVTIGAVGPSVTCTLPFSFWIYARKDLFDEPVELEVCGDTFDNCRRARGQVLIHLHTATSLRPN